ncbi:MAG: ROK family protein [Propionibacteriaceae bacterium]|nr:ROK family protein [Propionibacteriaceae bacterium]
MSQHPLIAIDIGGTWTRAAAITGDRLGAVHRAATRSDDRDAFLADLAGLVDAVRREESRPLGVAVSVTGPVDPATGRLYSPPNTGDGLDDLALGDWLAAHTGLPVRVDRDTNCALLGEVRAGAARDCRNVVFATFSTGVGGAVLLDGRLLRGRDGVAGEVGHTVVAGDGPLCGCGRRGCLEAVASGPAIALAGEQPNGQRVSVMAAAGDPVAQRALDRARRSVIAACVDWVNVFNPELVVLGGGVVQAHPDWLADAAGAVAREGLQPARRDCPVVPAVLGDEVALIGAAALFEDAL